MKVVGEEVVSGVVWSAEEIVEWRGGEGDSCCVVHGSRWLARDYDNSSMVWRCNRSWLVVETFSRGGGGGLCGS